MNLTTLSSEIWAGVTSWINGSIGLVEGFAGDVTELLVFLGITWAIVWLVFMVVKKIRG